MNEGRKGEGGWEAKTDIGELFLVPTPSSSPPCFLPQGYPTRILVKLYICPNWHDEINRPQSLFKFVPQVKGLLWWVYCIHTLLNVMDIRALLVIMSILENL